MNCLPTSSGTFSIQVVVTDAKDHSAGSSAGLTVSQGSGGKLAITSFSATPDPVVVGSNTTISVGVGGGTSPYTFTYSGLPAGCSSSNSSSIRCRPSVAGNFTVGVTVLDSQGNRVDSTLRLEVTANENGGASSAWGSIFPFILILVLAALAAVVLVMVAHRRSRKRQPAEEGAVASGPTLAAGAVTPASHGAQEPEAEEWKESEEPSPPPPESTAPKLPEPKPSDEWSEEETT
jgi:hypothetical protein